MHLIGFIIAGQRVDDDVDARAQRQFALTIATGNERIEWTATGIRCPSSREIIRGDDDG